ncbi:hypothetical protein ACE6H2_002580 [Prunus campanulata]
MRRASGFQQQSYGMRQEAQQQSYSMHQEAAWHSKDDYRSNHISAFSGVQIVPSSCLNSQLLKHNLMFDGSQALQLHDGSWHAQNMNQNGWCGSYNHASGAKMLMPLIGVTNASQFSQGAVFNNAMENSECEPSFHAVHLPATMRVQEMRYERSVWGNHDGLQYCHGFDDNVRWKRNGGWKSEWTSKGA